MLNDLYTCFDSIIGNFKVYKVIFLISITLGFALVITLDNKTIKDKLSRGAKLLTNKDRDIRQKYNLTTNKDRQEKP